MVSQSVRSILLSYQIQRVEKEIKLELEKNSEMEHAKNQIISLDHVDEIARKKLGFSSSSKGNVIVISLP